MSARRFHYRPWMGFGLWFAGVPLALAFPGHAYPISVGAFATGLLSSQLWPWGPSVFECWDGCEHATPPTKET